VVFRAHMFMAIFTYGITAIYVISYTIRTHLYDRNIAQRESLRLALICHIEIYSVLKNKMLFAHFMLNKL